MISVDDVIDFENDELSPEAEAVILQKLINSGDGWRLQGAYGRAMIAAIKSGRCLLGSNSARDAYGHYIPARDEVPEGAVGSRQFVEDRAGKDWLDLLESL